MRSCGKRVKLWRSPYPAMSEWDSNCGCYPYALLLKLFRAADVDRDVGVRIWLVHRSNKQEFAS